MVSVDVACTSSTAAQLCEELVRVPLQWVEPVAAIDSGSLALILAAAMPEVVHRRVGGPEPTDDHEHLFIETATDSAVRVVLSSEPGGEVTTTVGQVGGGRLWQRIRLYCNEFTRAGGFPPLSWLGVSPEDRWLRAADVVAAALAGHDPDTTFTVAADTAAREIVVGWSNGPCEEYVRWLTHFARPWPGTVFRYNRIHIAEMNA